VLLALGILQTKLKSLEKLKAWMLLKYVRTELIKS
jgi:hypothetical protein